METSFHAGRNRAPSEPRAAAATPSHRAGAATDSLAQFRARLAAGFDGRTELNLAAKGWGPDRGTLLGESSALESLQALDVSDKDLGVQACSRSLSLRT